MPTALGLVVSLKVLQEMFVFSNGESRQVSLTTLVLEQLSATSISKSTLPWTAQSRHVRAVVCCGREQCRRSTHTHLKSAELTLRSNILQAEADGITFFFP